MKSYGCEAPRLGTFHQLCEKRAEMRFGEIGTRRYSSNALPTSDDCRPAEFAAPQGSQARKLQQELGTRVSSRCCHKEFRCGWEATGTAKTRANALSLLTRWETRRNNSSGLHGGDSNLHSSKLHCTNNRRESWPLSERLQEGEVSLAELPPLAAFHSMQPNNSAEFAPRSSPWSIQSKTIWKQILN